MKITVLGNGSVKRKQVTEAIKSLVGEDDPRGAVWVVSTTEDVDLAPDAMRFANDWAEDAGVEIVIEATATECARIADLVLVAWDDAETDEIEKWVKAASGKVLDLTNDLAEITIEGEPDEAQQPSDERPVSGGEPPQENPALEVPTPNLSHGALSREETIELIELGKAARVLLNYVAAQQQ